ncbi:MAG: ribose-phosphate diphosphokinase [Puniceicoccales bacterium]|jgi:ribose-phosphate pyrophosphokinase|nr:ribose-phosphate diphosphokinase [Puniceicoccales bacterium]
MQLLAGTSHRALAEGIASHLRQALGAVEISEFPDGETRVCLLENLRGRDVFLLQSLRRPASHYLMELLMLADAARRADAACITAVLPFFAYARQNHRGQQQTALTAKLVANLLTTAGIRRLLTLELHTPSLTGFFDLPVEHLSADSLFLPRLQKQKSPRRSIASPDLGGAKRAALWADALHCPLLLLRKRRREGGEPAIVDALGEIENRDILLVDDMAETGSTLAAAAQYLRRRGAASVRAAVVHSSLNNAAQQHLHHSGLEALFTSNSIPTDKNLLPTDRNPLSADEDSLPADGNSLPANGDSPPANGNGGLPVTVLDLAPLLGDAIRRLHENRPLEKHFLA